MPFLTVNKVLKQRLLGAIDSLKNERENNATDQNKTEVDKIKAALDSASDFAKQHEFELGWNQFFIAQQQLVKLMTKEQKIIMATNLRIEASKITGWRQLQIFAQLGLPSEKIELIPANELEDRIIEVLKIKNDFYNTRNNKFLLKRALVWNP